MAAQSLNRMDITATEGTPRANFRPVPHQTNEVGIVVSFAYIDRLSGDRADSCRRRILGSIRHAHREHASKEVANSRASEIREASSRTIAPTTLSARRTGTTSMPLLPIGSINARQKSAVRRSFGDISSLNILARFQRGKELWQFGAGNSNPGDVAAALAFVGILTIREVVRRQTAARRWRVARRQGCPEPPSEPGRAPPWFDRTGRRHEPD